MTNLADGSDRTAMLGGFLDWFRGVAEHKLEGLTLDQATSVMVPSGTNMLGIVKQPRVGRAVVVRPLPAG